jgi:hypothetical protein
MTALLGPHEVLLLWLNSALKGGVANNSLRELKQLANDLKETPARERAASPVEPRVAPFDGHLP